MLADEEVSRLYARNRAHIPAELKERLWRCRQPRRPPSRACASPSSSSASSSTSLPPPPPAAPRRLACLSHSAKQPPGAIAEDASSDGWQDGWTWAALILAPNARPDARHSAERQPSSRLRRHRPGARAPWPSGAAWTGVPGHPAGDRDAAAARRLTLLPRHNLLRLLEPPLQALQASAGPAAPGGETAAGVQATQPVSTPDAGAAGRREQRAGVYVAGMHPHAEDHLHVFDALDHYLSHYHGSAELQQAFDRVDQDHSGTIDHGEFAVFVGHDLGLALTRKEIEVLFHSLDADGSDTLEASELVGGCREARRALLGLADHEALPPPTPLPPRPPTAPRPLHLDSLGHAGGHSHDDDASSTGTATDTSSVASVQWCAPGPTAGGIAHGTPAERGRAHGGAPAVHGSRLVQLTAERDRLAAALLEKQAELEQCAV